MTHLLITLAQLIAAAKIFHEAHPEVVDGALRFGKWALIEAAKHVDSDNLSRSSYAQSSNQLGFVENYPATKGLLTQKGQQSNQHLAIANQRQVTKGLLTQKDQQSPVNVEPFEISGQYVLCNYCRVTKDKVSISWRITRKRNIKCDECGKNNDFVTCQSCGSVWFRRTKKRNYKCVACDTKITHVG